MKSYRLTASDLKIVEDFVKVSAEKHGSRGRSITEVRADIATGKAGEIAYSAIMKSIGKNVSDMHLQNIAQTGGDFDVDGFSVEVKTGRKDSTWITFYNTRFNFDNLAIMKEVGNDEYEFVREMPVSSVKSQMKKSKFGDSYYIRL